MSEMLGDDFLVNRTPAAGGGGGRNNPPAGRPNTMRVVVKTLKKTADENAR